ncbi:MAG: redoxin domain-containing protein [bacterium]
MEAYRDQYAKLFNSGRNVVVIGVSVDPDTMLAAWARELQTPILFGSDVGQVVGKKYGSVRGNLDNRSVFVIDSSGRIVKRMQPFNELAQSAYDQLEAAVKSTLPAR